jgi:hypothetical protein
MRSLQNVGRWAAAVAVAWLLALALAPLVPVRAAAPGVWYTPKTNWVTGDVFTSASMNQIGFDLAALGNGMSAMTTGCSTADKVVNNSTVLVDVPGAFIDVGQNEKWVFTAYTLAAGSNVADINFAFNGPSAPTYVRYQSMGQPPAATAATAFGGRVNTVIGASVTNFYLVAGNVTTTNFGTIQLRMSQNVATVANTTVYAGSCLVGWRIR